MTPRCFSALAVAAAVLATPATSLAQQFNLGGSATLASGLAGGGAGKILLERARTRLTAGVDFSVDEFPKDVFFVGGVAEIEPHASFGLDGAYRRRVTPKLEVEAGGIGILFPESLIGPKVGSTYRIVLSRSLTLLAGAELDAFVVGSDLPGNSVVWEILLKVGVHVDL